MRVVVVSCIRNEQDIIEAFIRHTALYCDDIVVLDHGSTDRSPEILQSLQKDGLPLHLLRDDTLGQLEVEHNKRLLQIAVRDFSADWILALDADELIDGCADRSFLPEPGEFCLKLRLRNYQCHPDDDPRVVNPVERIAHRLEREPWHEGDLVYYKTIVPGMLARLDRAMFEQGKHVFLVDGEEPPHRVGGNVWLAHFSLRSASQYACKLMARKLQQIRMVGAGSEAFKFYDEHFDILRRSYSEFEAEFGKMRMGWLRKDGLDNMVRDPMRYRGGPLSYTPAMEGADEVVRSLFLLAERLIRPGAESNTAPEEEKPPLSIMATGLPVPARKVECIVPALNGVFQTAWLILEHIPETERIRFTLYCRPGVLEIRRISLRSADPLRANIVVEGVSLSENLSATQGAVRVFSNSPYVRLLISQMLAAFDFAAGNLQGFGDFTEVGIEFSHEDRNIGHVIFSPNVLERLNAEQKELSAAKQELALLHSKLERFGCDNDEIMLARLRGICRVGTVIRFTKAGNASRFKGGGWGHAEDWGTWTEGSRALLPLRFDPRPAGPLWVWIFARAFAPQGAGEARVTVRVNNRKLRELTVVAKPRVYGVQIPREEFAGETCDIVFEILNPLSPNELGLGPDMRKLGIGVTSIQFENRPATSLWRRLYFKKT